MSYDGQRRPGNYYERREREPSGEKLILRWILGIVSTLFVAAVVGSWQQGIAFAEVRADLRHLREEVTELKAWVNFQRRGGRDAS